MPSLEIEFDSILLQLSLLGVRADRQSRARQQEPVNLVDPNEAADRGKKWDFGLFNLAIDSKLRGCDVVAVRVDDVAPSGYAMDRATFGKKNPAGPRFELTDQARLAIDDYLRLTGRKPGEFLFAGRGNKGGLTTRQYARLVQEWVASIGLDAAKFGTHSLRRTKAVLIYRRTGNLRAVQLLLGHTHLDTTARYTQVATNVIRRVMSPIDRLIPLDAPDTDAPPPDAPPA